MGIYMKIKRGLKKETNNEKSACTVDESPQLTVQKRKKKAKRSNKLIQSMGLR